MLRQPRQDAFQIPKHVIVPKSQHTEFIRGEPAVTHGVAFGIDVLSTIDFNDQPRCEAEKIGDVRTKRNLSAKLEIGKSAVSQGEPKLALRIGHARTQLASGGSVQISRLTRLAPPALGTLSRKGRGFGAPGRATANLLPLREKVADPGLEPGEAG